MLGAELDLALLRRSNDVPAARKPEAKSKTAQSEA